MDDLRIGVIGLGFGQFHVQTLVNMPGVRLIAVADRTSRFPEGLEAYAARYGASAYDDGVAMIEQAELDAVSICTSPRYRAPLIEAAAKRGLPMFIEKPWAANVKQGDDLAELARAHNARIMLGFSFRFHPVVAALRRLIDGDLGAGVMLSGEYLFDWVPAPDNWLWDAENGGGFFNENSCHLIDVVCHLMGEPVSVFADGVNTRNSPSAEAAVVTIRFENGAIASLMIGGIGTNGLNAYPRLNIIAENGQALLQGETHYWQSLTWAARRDSQMTQITENPESLEQTRYTHALRHFVEQVRSGDDFQATVAHGLRAVAVAEAIYRSIERGQRVELEA